MSLEKATPTDSDTGVGVFQTPDESQLSHGPDNKSDEEVQLQADGPPDGGTGAWLAVLGAWCCSFNSFGWMNSKLRRPVSKLTWNIYQAPTSSWYSGPNSFGRRGRLSKLLRIWSSQGLRQQHYFMDPVARNLFPLFPRACRRFLV
jgi:hypothetical protein